MLQMVRPWTLFLKAVYQLQQMDEGQSRCNRQCNFEFVIYAKWRLAIVVYFKEAKILLSFALVHSSGLGNTSSPHQNFQVWDSQVHLDEYKVQLCNPFPNSPEVVEMPRQDEHNYEEELYIRQQYKWKILWLNISCKYPECTIAILP